MSEDEVKVKSLEIFNEALEESIKSFQQGSTKIDDKEETVIDMLEMPPNIQKLVKKINSTMPEIDRIIQNDYKEDQLTTEPSQKLNHLEQVLPIKKFVKGDNVAKIIRILDKNEKVHIQIEKDPKIQYFEDYSTKSEADLKLINDHMDKEVKKPKPYKLNFGAAPKKVAQVAEGPNLYELE